MINYSVILFVLVFGMTRSYHESWIKTKRVLAILDIDTMLENSYFHGFIKNNLKISEKL